MAAKCDFPLCEICEFAKARDCPKQALTMTKHITHYGSPKIGDICPISTVSIDHFESRLLGHTFNSCCRPSADKFFVGVSLSTMYLSIKMVSLQLRLSRQSRTLKNYVWIMVQL